MAEITAVVIGGSIAGMCAARVLSDVCARVTVIDRDEYPAGVGERPGVPQSRHVHALLAGGRRELERLFPGFDRLMLERGALEVDFLRDFATLRAAGWWPPVPSGFTTLFASRALVESILRELLRARANVELVERHAVEDLIAVGDGDPRVTGVRVRARAGGAVETVAADLVVDASGRSSHAPAWLGALGLEPPVDTVVDAFAGYSTRWYQAPPLDARPAGWWWKGVWIDPEGPEDHRAAVLFPIEHERWIVTIAGLARHYPPADEAGFSAALADLRSPLLAEAVRLATPISGVVCNRQMANRFRHYERWEVRLPGFVAIGDAVCSFNPVYGQGMTTAGLAAGILAGCLARHGPTDPELPRRFFEAQAAFLQEPWNMATGADFRYPTTAGARPLVMPLFNAYMDALFASSADDPVVRRLLGEVIHMLRPASSLFGPTIVARVALGTVRQRWSGRGTPAPIPAWPPPPAQG
jgi:2-polyprenyl-6-methoxyphenol hydroxylase-like FAD-dependent oxidoreductase